MKEDMRDFLRLGIAQHCLYPAQMESDDDFLEAFRILHADSDFEVIETAGPHDAGVWAETAKIIADRHVDLIYAANVDLYREEVFPISADPGKRERALELGLERVESFAEKGFHRIMFPNGPMPEAEDWDECMDLLSEYFIRLGRRAEECSGSLSVVMEILDNNPIAKNFMIGRSADAAELARRVREETQRFAICVDLAHMPLIGETPAESFAQCKEFVDCIHIGNCVLDGGGPFVGDEHPPFGVGDSQIGKGEITRLFREGVACGLLCEERRPSVSIEIIRPEGYEPATILREAKAIVREAWEEA